MSQHTAKPATTEATDVEKLKAMGMAPHQADELGEVMKANGLSLISLFKFLPLLVKFIPQIKGIIDQIQGSGLLDLLGGAQAQKK